MSATTSGGAIWRTIEVEAGHGVVLCDPCLSTFEVSRDTDAILIHITYTWRIFSGGGGGGLGGRVISEANVCRGQLPHGNGKGQLVYQVTKQSVQPSYHNAFMTQPTTNQH